MGSILSMKGPSHKAGTIHHLPCGEVEELPRVVLETRCKVALGGRCFGRSIIGECSAGQVRHL
jgi:hypothetical protein